jgi:hypothetical protein
MTDKTPEIVGVGSMNGIFYGSSAGVLGSYCENFPATIGCKLQKNIKN